MRVVAYALLGRCGARRVDAGHRPARSGARSRRAGASGAGPRPGQSRVAAAAADEDAAGLPAEQIEAGRTRFAAQCGFCHGRDAAGGEGGTDLTRSTLVADDVRGDRHRAARAVRPRRRGDAGVHAVRRRPRGHRRLHPRSEAPGGHRRRRPPHVSTRRSCRPATRRRGSATSTRACARCHSATAISRASRRATRGCRCCSACSIRARRARRRPRRACRRR